MILIIRATLRRTTITPDMQHAKRTVNHFLHLATILYYYYYMTQVTSRKIARCDWLLTQQDFSVMTRVVIQTLYILQKIRKLLMHCEQKLTQNRKKKNS